MLTQVTRVWYIFYTRYYPQLRIIKVQDNKLIVFPKPCGLKSIPWPSGRSHRLPYRKLRNEAVSPYLRKEISRHTPFTGEVYALHSRQFLSLPDFAFHYSSFFPCSSGCACVGQHSRSGYICSANTFPGISSSPLCTLQTFGLYLRTS